MIWTTCKYCPLELLAGFGEATQRLDPHPSSFSCAEEESHPNLCGFAKAVLEEVRRKRISRLVLTDCCDAMRRVYDVLKKEPSVRFLFFLSLPHKGQPEDVRRLEASLRKLIWAYGEFSGRPFDVDLAYQAYRERREPEIPSFGWIALEGAHGGSLVQQMAGEYFGKGAVLDRTCSGNRRLGEKTGKKEDFLRWYAEDLLHQKEPCMRMRQKREYPEDPNCRGIIYHTIKFCDWYGFEYMHWREKGLPILKIETDTSPQSMGQLSTRLEAFAESLGMRKMKQEEGRMQGKIIAAGVDSGSASTDAVVLDEDRKILGSCVIPTREGNAPAARALQEALAQAGLKREDLSIVVTTGYGRETTGLSDVSVTEITCHAKGAHFLEPRARTVIDIGGQDSKVIRIDEKGSVKGFAMNDKCAAGTGRFLEAQARALGMSLEEMAKKGMEWKKDLDISSMCTVFAESEVVSLVARKEESADIIHGLNKAIAAKTASLVKREGGMPEYIMTGGVARNEGVVRCLEQALGERVAVSEYSQLCGSIGAALLGLESFGKGENG